MTSNNLIDNRGFADGATNTKDDMSFYVTDISEVSFPLKGPTTVKRNLGYDSLFYKMTQRAGFVIRLKEIFGLDINRSVFELLSK